MPRRPPARQPAGSRGRLPDPGPADLVAPAHRRNLAPCVRAMYEPGKLAEVVTDARGDLRRRGDRRLHRLLPQPARRRGARGRAHRRRLRRLGQVGRLPGAGLVRRLPPWPPRPAQLRPPCRARRRRSTAAAWGYRRLDTWSVLAGAAARSWPASRAVPGLAGSARARWCRASSVLRRPRRRCTRRGSPRRCCRRRSIWAHSCGWDA